MAYTVAQSWALEVRELEFANERLAETIERNRKRVDLLRAWAIQRAEHDGEPNPFGKG